MARRLVLAALAAAGLVILVCCVVGGEGAGVVFAVAATAFPFALMALGALRGGRLGAAAVPVAALLVPIELALVGMLLSRGRVLDGPWLGGLPLAAALQVYGIFLLPLAVTALGFALTFRRLEVSRDDLERLKRLTPKEPG